MAPTHEPPVGPSWAARAQLPPLAAVLDPGDLLGAKNRLIDRVQKAALKRALGRVRGLRVLDFGCGTGRMTDWLAEQGAEVEGVDPSPEMVAAAKETYSERSFAVSEMPLAAPDETYDVVLTTGVLQYPVVDRASFGPLVADLARVIRPGGQLVAIEQVQPGALPVGAPCAEYEDAIGAAGLTLVERRPVRWGSSRILRFAERHPRIRLFPLLPQLIQLEVRLAPFPPEGLEYFDVLFRAERQKTRG